MDERMYVRTLPSVLKAINFDEDAAQKWKKKTEAAAEPQRVKSGVKREYVRGCGRARVFARVGVLPRTRVPVAGSARADSSKMILEKQRRRQTESELFHLFERRQN